MYVLAQPGSQPVHMTPTLPPPRHVLFGPHAAARGHSTKGSALPPPGRLLGSRSKLCLHSAGIVFQKEGSATWGALLPTQSAPTSQSRHCGPSSVCHMFCSQVKRSVQDSGKPTSDRSETEADCSSIRAKPVGDSTCIVQRRRESANQMSGKVPLLMHGTVTLPPKKTNEMVVETPVPKFAPLMRIVSPLKGAARGPLRARTHSELLEPSPT